MRLSKRFVAALSGLSVLRGACLIHTEIISVPAGAEVIVDDEPTGEITPYVLTQRQSFGAGRATQIRLRAPDRESQEDTVRHVVDQGCLEKAMTTLAPGLYLFPPMLIFSARGAWCARFEQPRYEFVLEPQVDSAIPQP